MAYSSTAGFDRTWKWAAKTAWGYPFNYLKNVIEHVFGYTHFGKKVSAASATAILASTASKTSSQTITTGITNPDVPRLLTATLGGTGLIAGNITITGSNVEGKTISENIAYSGTGTVNGTLVFKTVSSIVFPAQSGASGTLTVGTQNKLGLVHRLQPSYATAVIVQDTAIDTTRPTVQAAPSSSNFDDQLVEKNWLQPATTPDGTTFLYFFYWMHKVKVQPPQDDPDFYSTTTSTSSTSSSSSTSSTSSSTSISSTSSSISSTSSSISTTVSTSTSISTSSTSTSTTTLPI